MDILPVQRVSIVEPEPSKTLFEGYVCTSLLLLTSRCPFIGAIGHTVSNIVVGTPHLVVRAQPLYFLLGCALIGERSPLLKLTSTYL